MQGDWRVSRAETNSGAGEVILNYHDTYEFNNIEIFDPTPILCKAIYCAYEIDNTFIYRDPHHLTQFGGQYYGTIFKEWANYQRLD